MDAAPLEDAVDGHAKEIVYNIKKASPTLIDLHFVSSAPPVSVVGVVECQRDRHVCVRCSSVPQKMCVCKF